MRILITGANGMLGQDLAPILKEEGFDVVSTDIDSLNITDVRAVENYLGSDKYDFVIHAAAYTNVDGAEAEPEKAFLINHAGTENLAKTTAKYGIPIAYISTDYVFDGTKDTPYEPEDKTNPLNVYGSSKLKGEEAIKLYNPNHYIARTSWLYGHNGKNFIETIIKLAAQNSEIKVVNDQIGCPTWTVDLSCGLLDLIRNKKPFGIYHICGSGCTTWYGFAVKILELADIRTKVIPVSTEEFPRPATRPKYSVMSNNETCPMWNKSLEKYIIKRN